MRNYGKCLKCGANNIARVEGNVNADGTGNYISLGLIKTALITRYICLNCGFSEEYIEGHSLDKLRSKYRGR